MKQVVLGEVAGGRNQNPSGDGAVVAQSSAGCDRVAAQTEHPMVGLLAALGPLARGGEYDVPSMRRIAGQGSGCC